MKIENHLNVIRLSEQGDAVAMAYLFGQLGYPASPVEVAERWLQPAPDREVLLACHEVEVVGVLVWGLPCWRRQKLAPWRKVAASWNCPAVSNGKMPIVSICLRVTSSVRSGS